MTNSTTLAANVPKTSVVDDFFSALFAGSSSLNTNSNSNSNNSSNETAAATTEESYTTPIPSTNAASSFTTTTTTTNIPVKKSPKVESSTSFTPTAAAPNNYKREHEVLDEFDEYNLLSKRKSVDSHTRTYHNEPNTDAAVVEEYVKPKILAKRDIDWSTVIPESRMLIRQLPEVSKQELLDHFSVYGEVLEVVQKKLLGFVHFENPEVCQRAVENENGKIYRGIKLELEICKQKPYFARNSGGPANKYKQNKNSDYSLDRDAPEPEKIEKRRNSSPIRSGNSNTNTNRFHPYSQPQQQYQQNDYNNRDHSPLRKNKIRRTDDYNNKPREERNYNDYNSNNNNNNNNSSGSGSGRDDRNYNNRAGNFNRNANAATTNNVRYGGYNNHQVRSPSNQQFQLRNESPPTAPAAQQHHNNYTAVPPPQNPSRYSQPIPTAPVSYQATESPTVKIISWGNVDPNFVLHVKDTLSACSITVSSWTLPSHDIQTRRGEVVRQLIIEGVKAIIMIEKSNEFSGRVYLQLFKSGGQGSTVSYDEYESVTPTEATSLIQRAYPSKPYYVSPTQQIQQQHHTPAALSPQPNLSNINTNTLANLLSMIKPSPNAISSSQPTPPSITQQQPTVSQLLATLVNGLSSNGTASPQNNSTPTLPPAAPVSTPSPVVPQQSEQPSIAALVNTASAGNPMLAQLLGQLTTGIAATSMSSPNLSHNSIATFNNNVSSYTSPAMTPSQSQSQYQQSPSQQQQQQKTLNTSQLNDILSQYHMLTGNNNSNANTSVEN